MLINGREIAGKLYQHLQDRVGELKKIRVVPRLTVILVGEEQASLAYVKQKQKWGQFIGAEITLLKFPEIVTTEELIRKIQELNGDSANHAILIQRPLPPQIDINKLELLVDPEKDIDGFHPDSLYVLPLPLAVIEILKEIYQIKNGQVPEKIPPTPFNKGGAERVEFLSWLRNQKIVIIGKGTTGGGPILKYFNKLDIHPTLIDSKTSSPEQLTKNADIIISAIGKPDIIASDKIKEGAILIGVGIFRSIDGKLHGDFQESDIADKVSFYTPTPGGVGPVNVAMLMGNLLTAAERQTKV